MTSELLAPATRPLVVRCGAFGDMVLITTLIRALHRRFGAPVDVLTSGPWSAPLLHGQPGVGEVWCVRSRRTPYWLSRSQQRAVRRLRSRGVGPTWFCDGDGAAWPLLMRAGIPVRSIVDVRAHALEPGEHATEQWLRLAQLTPAGHLPAAPLATPSDDAPGGGVELAVSAAQRHQLDLWLLSRGIAEPFIAVQVGNKRTMRRGTRRLAANHKYWPPERWSATLEHLRARHPAHAIVMLGTGPEFELNRQIAARARIERLFNVADDLAVPRLVALLARAAALLTVDSGPAHVAAAVGCPQVVLFGKASPSLYRPRGAAGADVVVLTGEFEGVPSMLGITTTQVEAAWGALRLREG